VELRSPDPACNPYLAFALMLSAGLRGIENEYELPAPIEENIFDMNSEVRKLNNIQALPDTLENAALLFSNSELARETLGNHVFQSLLANKKVEWDRYRTAVTSYEWEKYLPVL
jgi:glutamine synthetase